MPANTNGMRGNCAGIPLVDYQPAPATYTPSPTYEGTATSTPQPTTLICTGNATVDGLEVFASPAYSGGAIGSLSQGQTVTIIGAYYGGDANNWFQIEYPGGSGWVFAVYTITLNGNCGNIPPTPVLPIAVPIDYTASVGLDVGATSQFTQTLPGGNGDRAHVIAVKVEGIPQGNEDTSYYRTVRMEVTCTGASASTLRWGMYGNTSLGLACGQGVDINMGMGWDSQYYVFQIPPDGSASYTISLTVNPYAGP